jgi:hypothetical protein
VRVIDPAHRGQANRAGEARQLLDMWSADTLDNRLYVTCRAMASGRRLAAIVHSARTPEQRLAADETASGSRASARSDNRSVLCAFLLSVDCSYAWIVDDTTDWRDR